MGRKERFRLNRTGAFSRTAGVLGLSLILITAGACSRDEPPQTLFSQKVVMPIQKPRWLAQGGASEETVATPPSLPMPVTPVQTIPSAMGPAPSPPPREPPPDPDPKGMTGLYQVRKGDTLLKISGLKEVYGDPLKWPSLFRQNMGKLTLTGEEPGFERKELPEGLELKFRTPSRTAPKPGESALGSYAVNVISSRTGKEIVSPAVTLMKNGYHVYITRADLNGKEWLRLRVGFFKDYSCAAEQGERIKSLLGNPDSWIVKVKDGELEEFGGY